MLATRLLQIIFWSGFSCAFTFLIIWNSVLGWLVMTWLEKSDFARFYYAAVAFMENQEMYAPNSATLAAWTPLFSQHTLDLAPPHFPPSFSSIIFVSH